MKTYTIGLLQSAAHRALVSHTYHFLEKYDITPGQWAILGLTHEHNSIRVTDVTKALHIRPSSASEIVQNLINKNYLTRSLSNSDRRVRELQLTKDATRFIEKTEPLLKQHMKPLLKGVSSNDFRGYITVLESITTNHC